MTLKRIGWACAAAGLVAAPAVSSPGAPAFSVRNDTGDTLTCQVTALGSSQSERIVVRAGASWTKGYAKAKDRRIRCDGTYSRWERISPGGSYALVRTGGGMIVLRRLGG